MSNKVKPHIVIDARLYGPAKTGIGRYTQNLLLALPQQKNFNKYQFGLIVKQEDLDTVKQDLGISYRYFPTDISHYSFSEQILLPPFISKLKPNLVHFTHFNKPLFYTGLSVITIHDLIKHYFRGKSTTTKSVFTYWPKYLAYRLATKINIKDNYIIVPSNFWRNILLNRFGLSSSKITTIYEAADPKFLKLSSKICPPKNYILYTGNLYPHKNIKVVFEALQKLPGIQLKIICARSVFQKEAEVLSQKLGVDSQVTFLGFVKDSDFPKLYSQALCLVHPSFLEGFSLTGLEAMSLNCLVIAASSSCLPEIYGSSVLYFDPHNKNDLVNQITLLLKDQSHRFRLIKLGHKQITKYSWTKTASSTLKIYEKILERS